VYRCGHGVVQVVERSTGRLERADVGDQNVEPARFADIEIGGDAGHGPQHEADQHLGMKRHAAGSGRRGHAVVLREDRAA
jgi:hypothetical protein